MEEEPLERSVEEVLRPAPARTPLPHLALSYRLPPPAAADNPAGEDT